MNFLDSVKKNWYYYAGFVVAAVGLTYLVAMPGKMAELTVQSEDAILNDMTAQHEFDQAQAVQEHEADMAEYNKLPYLERPNYGLWGGPKLSQVDAPTAEDAAAKRQYLVDEATDTYTPGLKTYGVAAVAGAAGAAYVTSGKTEGEPIIDTPVDNKLTDAEIAQQQADAIARQQAAAKRAAEQRRRQNANKQNANKTKIDPKTGKKIATKGEKSGGLGWWWLLIILAILAVFGAVFYFFCMGEDEDVDEELAELADC